MKKILKFFVAILMTASIFLPHYVAAQAPERMSYQAVIRNSSNELVKNSQIGMKISILQDSSNGTAIYAERQAPISNENGLISIEIGGGTNLSGDFATIDWGSKHYFLKTEIDPTGWINYTISEVTQLISVPYALHAKTAENIIGVNIKTYKVGDFAQGGIVFWVDETGQHGLVCNKMDHNAAIRWYAGTNMNTMAKAEGLKGGLKNTSLIIAVQGMGDRGSYAARVCNELNISEDGETFYGDWYLPSIGELKLMYKNKAIIDSTALEHAGSSFTTERYWSSSEYLNFVAWHISFLDGEVNANYDKANALYVRAVRAF